jgi:predicted nucleotidyltransferase
MRDRHQATLYLFGSRARDTARSDRDYDVVAVSATFAEQPWYERCRDYRALWVEAGGWRIGLDLLCFTPAEFARELDGYGAVGSANRQGELKRLLISKRAAA